MDKKNKDLILVLLLAVSCFLIYFNSFNVPFCFDDGHMVKKNILIKDPVRVKSLFFGQVTSASIAKGMCRPLLMLSFMFNYLTGGINPAGYHVINVLLHFLNAALVYVLLRHLRKDFPPFFIFIIALGFLSHPLHTEAVTYVSSRSDLLSGTFIILGVILYLKNRLCFSGLCYAAALLSKETGLCLILIIPAYELIAGAPALKEKLKTKKFRLYYLFLFFLTVIYLLYRSRYFLPEQSVFIRSGYSNFLIQSVVSFFYLRMFLFPYPLNIIHNIKEFGSILNPPVLLAVTGIITMAGLIFCFRRKRPLISFGLSWYLIFLLPKFYAKLNLPAAEHHFYMPAIGIYIILAVLTYRLYSVRARYFIPASLIIICFWSSLVLFRNFEWQDSFRFWQVTVRRDPLSWGPWLNLAKEYRIKDNTAMAGSCLKKSLVLADKERHIRGKVSSRVNLAILYIEEGRLDKAEELLNQALSLTSGYYKIYYVLGKIYYLRGEKERAVKTWETGLKRYPLSPEICRNMSEYYAGNGQREQALVYARKAVDFSPESPEGYGLLMRLFLEQGETGQAMEVYEETAGIIPDYYRHFMLGMAYVKTGKYLSGLEEFEVSLVFNKEFAPAYYNAAIVYLSLGDMDKTEEYLSRAVFLGYKVPGSLLDKLEYYRKAGDEKDSAKKMM